MNFLFVNSFVASLFFLLIFTTCFRKRCLKQPSPGPSPPGLAKPPPICMDYTDNLQHPRPSQTPTNLHGLHRQPPTLLPLPELPTHLLPKAALRGDPRVQLTTRKTMTPCGPGKAGMAHVHHQVQATTPCRIVTPLPPPYKEDAIKEAILLAGLPAPLLALHAVKKWGSRPTTRADHDRYEAETSRDSAAQQLAHGLKEYTSLQQASASRPTRGLSQGLQCPHFRAGRALHRGGRTPTARLQEEGSAST